MNPAPRARHLAPALAALCAAIAWLAIPGHAAVAAEGESHLFTSKNGQQISAVLLDVSTDRKLMTIRRDDGQQFQTEITSLSLDDQQYVREWLNNRPVTANYLIDLKIQRKQSNTRRRNVSGSLTLESRVFEYEIIVGNRSRESLSGARLEYAVVLDDQITPFDNPGGELSYRLASGEGTNHVRISGGQDLEPIAFNREHTVQSRPAPIHVLRFANSGVLREDELLGVRARLMAADGSVIAEESSGNSALERLDWEAISDLLAVEDEEQQEADS